MSERLPNTSSAHAVRHGRVILPALRTGIWKHGGMFSAAHMAVSGLTPVVVSGSLGPKLPFRAFEAGRLHGTQTLCSDLSSRLNPFTPCLSSLGG